MSLPSTPVRSTIPSPFPQWMHTAAAALGVDVVHVAAIWSDGWAACEEHWEARHAAAAHVAELAAREILHHGRRVAA